MWTCHSIQTLIMVCQIVWTQIRIATSEKNQDLVRLQVRQRTFSPMTTMMTVSILIIVIHVTRRCQRTKLAHIAAKMFSVHKLQRQEDLFQHTHFILMLMTESQRFNEHTIIIDCIEMEFASYLSQVQ